MLKLGKVAVTGGLAAGKSTVCRLLEERGALTVDADEIVHQLLTPDTDIGKKIVALLGDDIIVGNQLSRPAIAEKVFQDRELLHTLETWIHPEVQKIVEKTMAQNPNSLIVVEIPLYYESPFFTSTYDTVIAVIADQELCKQRFLQTTGYGAEEYERRTARMLPQEEKARRADIVIINNGSLDSLKQHINQL